jgi:hypothetical protein
LIVLDGSELVRVYLSFVPIHLFLPGPGFPAVCVVIFLFWLVGSRRDDFIRFGDIGGTLYHLCLSSFLR